MAQVSDNFVRMTCEGEIPADFTTVFSTKFQEDLIKHRNDGVLNKRQSREFSALTNYSNDNLLLSGLVLYGDPVSTLAQKIADKLLADKDLDEPVRVYTIKTNQVNAYSTQHGIIYITIGLISRLENEAQLAFILAHEIGHYLKKHSLEAYNNQVNLDQGRNVYRHLNMEERMLTSYKYAREAETEADKIGYELYTAAGYDAKVCMSTFDLLLRAYLPWAEMGVDWSVYESEHFEIPSKLKVTDNEPIKLVEDVDDSERTHPNTKKRKEEVSALMKHTQMREDTAFYMLSDQVNFKKIRDLARFESLNIFLKNARYPMALYTASALKLEHGNHPFLLKIELMAWAGMQIFSNNSQKSAYNDGYKNYEGQQQILRYWISKTNRKEVNTLAVKFIWENYQKLPKSDFIEAIKNQCLRELVSKSGLKRDFYAKVFVESNDSVVSTRKSNRKSRYQYCSYAFIDLFRDSTFTSAYDAAFDNKNDASNVDENEDEEDEEMEVIAENDENIRIRSESKIDKLVMLSPRYFNLDLRKNIEKNVIGSSIEQQDLTQRLNKVASKLPIELDILDDRTKGNMNTSSFNDYSLIIDWLTEESKYDGSDFYSFYTQNLDTISATYGTNYIGTNVIWTTTERREFSAGTAFFSLIFYPLFPVYLVWQLRPMREMEYSFLVYDINSGNAVWGDYFNISSKYRKDFINAHLYNSLNQVIQK